MNTQTPFLLNERCRSRAKPLHVEVVQGARRGNAPNWNGEQLTWVIQKAVTTRCIFYCWPEKDAKKVVRHPKAFTTWRNSYRSSGTRNTKQKRACWPMYLPHTPISHGKNISFKLEYRENKHCKRVTIKFRTTRRLGSFRRSHTAHSSLLSPPPRSQNKNRTRNVGKQVLHAKAASNNHHILSLPDAVRIGNGRPLLSSSRFAGAGIGRA